MILVSKRFFQGTEKWKICVSHTVNTVTHLEWNPHLNKWLICYQVPIAFSLSLSLSLSLFFSLSLLLSTVWLFVTLWTTAQQAPLSIEFSRQEYWNRLPFPFPGDIPDPGIEFSYPVSPSLQAGFFVLFCFDHLNHLGSPENTSYWFLSLGLMIMNWNNVK